MNKKIKELLSGNELTFKNGDDTNVWTERISVKINTSNILDGLFIWIITNILKVKQIEEI